MATHRDVPRHFSRSSGFAAIITASGLATTAFGQWTVISLHPNGATSSEATSVHGAEQAGMWNFHQGALVWHGSAGSVLRLPDAGNPTAVANAVNSGNQSGTIDVGTGVDARTHAVIWSGPAHAIVDLHPAPGTAIHSVVYAMDATTQGGTFLGDGGGGTFSAGRPCMWSGTSESFVDLTPAGFSTGEVHGVGGGQQVGATFDSFLGTACMWFGSAESFVNLQPPEGIFSAATCTDGMYQYGVMGLLDPAPGLYPCRWNGSAESLVVLDMPVDHWGEVHATHGGVQAGYITDTDGISHARACIWEQVPGTYLDIHQYVPAPYSESNALGIWRHESSGTIYVVGYGLNSVTNQTEALMWVRGPGTNLIASASAPQDGSVDPGESMGYNVRVLNAGPVPSGPYTVTVDLPPASVATYVSATPSPSGVSATQLTFTMGSLAGLGGTSDIAITLNAVGAGSTATVTATATPSAEAEPTNNTASASSRITGTPITCDSIDFNGDALFPDTADIDDFLSVFSGGPCSTGTCGDIDFNNDGLFPDTLDIDSLLSVFSGGPCL
ncbi:MAG: hypothetical protein U0637_09245 [Phycisphaerales bacterium]